MAFIVGRIGEDRSRSAMHCVVVLEVRMYIGSLRNLVDGLNRFLFFSGCIEKSVGRILFCLVV